MIVKECNAIDSKGRFYFPKKDREDFKDKVVIFRFHDYLCFLTMQEWNQLLTKKLKGLKWKEFHMMERYLWSSVFVKKIDKWKRVYVPSGLRERRKYK